MKKEPLISIVVPIYNVERYLRQCLDSIINQTYKNIEIIVVEDSSKDSSLRIAKEYKEKDNRIILIENEENKGVSYSRNRAIKEASGEYITFVDADDFVGETYILYIYNFLIDNNVDIAITRYFTYDEVEKNGWYFLTEGRVKPNIYDKIMNIQEFWQNKIFINHSPFILFSIKTIKENNILFKEEIKLAEDLLFLIEYIYNTKNCKIVISDKAHSYYYRQHRKSATKNKKISKDIFLAFNYLEDFLKEKKAFQDKALMRYFILHKAQDINVIHKNKAYDILFIKRLIKEVQQGNFDLIKDTHYYKKFKRIQKRKYLEYVKYFLKVLKISR